MKIRDVIAELAPPSVPCAPSAPRPPGELRTLAAAIGEDAVLRLLEKRGGTSLYIPGTRLTPDAGIGNELGLDAGQCERLRMLHGNNRLKVPLCRPWRAQLYRWRMKLSYSQIALRLGVTESAVHVYLRDGGQTQPNRHQMSLPL
jgi:hypothetical protein